MLLNKMLNEPEENEPDPDLEELDTDRKKRNSNRNVTPPPPVVARQNQALYGGPTMEDMDTGVTPSLQQGQSSLLSNLNLNRLVTRLQERPRELTIVVNQVEICLPVIGWDLQPRSLLCFVTGDVSCKLPLTNDVKIHLGEEILSVTFIGQWHKMEWLPFQVVSFVIPESE
jgi:hypothetical protein